uniref:Ubiquitin carboxyl-terminal hydrolase n=1 Tax=Rodentolepis nana TaxID=102285 RepID=A0A0R3TC69_RODNA
LIMRWVPLESNPDVLNKFIRELGVKEPLRLEDVYGTDPEMQALVPGPVLSLLLLYPLNEETETNPIGTLSPEEKCFFMKQTIHNACGTVAIIHALANNTDAFDIKCMPFFLSLNFILRFTHLNLACFLAVPWLCQFLEKTSECSPKHRGQALENEEELSEIHEIYAQEGQTEAPDSESRIDLHFIAFINANGHLIELDGRKDGPILHGDTSNATFLADACKVIDKFMARDPTNLNFSLMALTNAPI